MTLLKTDIFDGFQRWSTPSTLLVSRWKCKTENKQKKCLQEWFARSGNVYFTVICKYTSCSCAWIVIFRNVLQKLSIKSKVHVNSSLPILCLLIFRRTALLHSHSDWKILKNVLCKLHSSHNCFEKIKPKDFVSALF